MLMKAYLANGLFSEADQMYNAYLAKNMRRVVPAMELYNPMENERLNDKQNYADSVMIFNGDNTYLDQSDLLIAVLDGPVVDDGVAAELGRFALLCEQQPNQKEVLALYTDVRQQGRDNVQKIGALVADSTENQFMYRNLYVIGGAKKVGKIFSSSEALFAYLQTTYGK